MSYSPSLILSLSSLSPTCCFRLPFCFRTHTICCPMVSHLPQPPGFCFLVSHVHCLFPSGEQPSQILERTFLYLILHACFLFDFWKTPFHPPRLRSNVTSRNTVLTPSSDSFYFLLCPYTNTLNCDYMVTLCSNVSLPGWQGHEMLAYSR